MKISVVIPAYNAEKHIARAIESVLAQTRPADEVIVIDDGSSDGTGDVVRSFGDKVIFIQQENAGASVARNAGIEAATSDWIAFLDADDEWLPNKIELQIAQLKRNPDLAWAMSNYFTCFCDPEHSKTAFDKGRSEILLAGRDYYEDYFDAYKAGASGNTNTMLIQKEVLLEAGLFRPSQARMNDEDMWFRIAYRHPKVGYLTTPLAIYHRGVADSIVKKHNHPEIV
ncbi:MAG: glycosyltransferase family 2 protein, partial [Planctomycetota bacterium]